MNTIQKKIPIEKKLPIYNDYPSYDMALLASFLLIIIMACSSSDIPSLIKICIPALIGVILGIRIKRYQLQNLFDKKLKDKKVSVFLIEFNENFLSYGYEKIYNTKIYYSGVINYKFTKHFLYLEVPRTKLKINLEIFTNEELKDVKKFFEIVHSNCKYP